MIRHFGFKTRKHSISFLITERPRPMLSREEFEARQQADEAEAVRNGIFRAQVRAVASQAKMQGIDTAEVFKALHDGAVAHFSH